MPFPLGRRQLEVDTGAGEPGGESVCMRVRMQDDVAGVTKRKKDSKNSKKGLVNCLIHKNWPH